MTRLTLTFLGPLQASLGDAPLPIRSPRITALLAYLALEASTAHTRDELAALFWPDESDRLAKQNVRQALYQLRQVLGEPDAQFLLVSRDTVQFDSRSDHTLDAAEFQRHVRRGELDAAVALYRGELLAQTTGSSQFDEWLTLRRERLHIMALDALHELTEQALERANPAAAQRYARRQLELEPWREHAHRQLMLALAQSGDRSAALVQFETCRRVMEAELGVDPEPETRALYEQIRDGALPTSQRPARREPRAPAGPGELGDLPAVGTFYGRAEELRQLGAWLTAERCRLIAVTGLGGIGKTALTAQVVRQCAAQFDVVIWRSLLNAPAPGEVLGEILRTLSGHVLTQLPNELDAQLSMLVTALRERPCLLVLDNAESVMQEGERAGAYRPGYEEYGQIFLRVGQASHQSSVVITTREQPREVAQIAGETPLVRTLPLAGLDRSVGVALLAGRGLAGTERSSAALVERYSGNPLALKLVAEAIQELFGGDIAAFIADETLIFDDIRDVLKQQYARLTPLERDILLWMAVEREPVTEAQLRESFARTAARRALLEALRSLLRRSLLERRGSAFGLQNVVTEFLTDELVSRACDEIDTGKLELLHTHALIRPSTKEHVRLSQQRVILRPIGERLVGRRGRAALGSRLTQIIAAAERAQPPQPSYLAGNLLNLLLQLGIGVRGLDFSKLSVWHAYLRGHDLPEVSFSSADLTGSVFTDYVGAVTSAAISPDGQLLAAGADNSVIYLWRLSDLQLVGLCEGHEAHVWSLAFDPDGRRLVSASDDQTVRVWDVAGRRQLRVLAGHTSGVASVALHREGRIAASGSSDQTVRLWDTHTGELVSTLRRHGAMVPALSFSPDGELLATGSHDQTLCLWDWRRGSMLTSLVGHTAAVTALCFRAHPLAGQTLLASASHDQTVRLWDTERGAARATLLGHQAPVIAAAWSANGAWLYSGSDDQTVRVWDTRTPDRLGDGAHSLRVLHGHYGAVTVLAVHPRPEGDQEHLVSGGYDKTMRLWDIPSGENIATLRGHSNWLQTAVFDPGGRVLVAGSNGQYVRVWDGLSGRARFSWGGHTSLTEKLALRADGRQLASASWDQTIRIWDLAGGRVAHVLHGHTAPVVTAVFGTDDAGRELVVSGGLDRAVRVWHAETGGGIAVYHGHIDRVVALAVQPGGARLASGSWDHTIRLWDIRTGGLVRTFYGNTAPVECVAFSPQGDLLASGGWDRDVRVWDAHTGGMLHDLAGHTNGLEMVAFSPDGSLLASCGCDHMVCVWDVRRGRLLHMLRGHSSWVRSIAFRQDSSVLASASDDGTVRLWDIGTGACLHTIAMEDPYTAMDITGATGLTAAQRAALKRLGAVEAPELQQYTLTQAIDRHQDVG